MPVCGTTVCGMAACGTAPQGEAGESGNMVRGWGRGGQATCFFNGFFSLCFFFSLLLTPLPFTALSGSDLVLSESNLFLSGDDVIFLSDDWGCLSELLDMTGIDVCTCESSLTFGTDINPCILVGG